VTKKYERVVDVLIRNGCNVNNQTEAMRSTSLHLAVMEKQEGIVELLLQHGADPNVEDIDFCTPLHYAAEYSLFDIVEIMLASEKVKINFQIKNNKNMTIADCCRDPRIK
jgi:ankyrin repeat protein